MRIVGILLAAGEGARFGGGKLLARVPRTAYGVSAGTPIGAASAMHLMAALNDVVAIVRPRDAMLEAHWYTTGARVVPVRRAAEGMARASRAAYGSAPMPTAGSFASCGHAVDRADQHRRGGRCDSRRRRGSWRRQFEGKRGHPVGFSRKYGSLLAALDGDEGARSIIAARQFALCLVDVEDPGVLRDVDRPSDLA
jgi:molybdenum cofactor cytidylyltransferase